MAEEISREVTSFIMRSPAFQQWPECQHLLMNMLATDEPWIHALPIWTCKAVGGVQAEAIPVAAAWITLLHASSLIDDIQDGDLDLVTQFERPEIALTIAITWIFAAFRMLADPLLDLQTRNKIVSIFANAGFDSSMGQYQGLVLAAGKSDSSERLQDYWNTIILKSGSICMAGAAAGAAVGKGSPALVEALGDYGTALGVIRQVIDDCRDLSIDAKNPGKQCTLPALLHSMVSDQRFRQHKNRKDKLDRSESQFPGLAPQLLVEAGIPEIIADILLEWRRRALQSLHGIEPSQARNELENILDHVLTTRPHNL
jgi:geranylgeranyl pyrophosphate synthase